MNTTAQVGCYGCRGTGRVVGFSAHGLPCICVNECEDCGEAIAWGHDDEKAPAKCERCVDLAGPGMVS